MRMTLAGLVLLVASGLVGAQTHGEALPAPPWLHLSTTQANGPISTVMGTWGTVPGAMVYGVEYRLASARDWIAGPVLARDALATWESGHLPSGALYVFRVRAGKGNILTPAQWGPWSDPSNAAEAR